ncbi:hypothetical protein L484_015304 [Morus notabilis]|uniref:Transmembrane protein n=1 Tax=Morus notabilis TaxID=981085 RepID=W9RIB3_9ROSA|nr:uncharacterized protein LOC21398407 [Morus notabilis]EXB93316.1 hypothetical protein L484_015304 [Morus notabilis]
MLSSSVQSLSLKPVSFSLERSSKHVKDDVLTKAYYKYSFLSSSSSSSSSSLGCRFVCSSVEKESQQFEVDQDKAREALKQLDQQLQSLSQKQVRSPKIKATDVNLTTTRDQTTEEAQDFSGSFLAYTAGALFLLTIFYNVFFYAVIKPAIDGPDESPTRVVERQIAK